VRVEIHFDITDVAIHKTDDVFGIVKPALPRRQFLRLMPGPAEESRHVRQQQRLDRAFYRSLFPTEYARKGSLVKVGRRRIVGKSIAAIEPVTGIIGVELVMQTLRLVYQTGPIIIKVVRRAGEQLVLRRRSPVESR